MKGYKFLPDIATADIAFEAHGENLNELFEACAEAVFASMADLKTIQSLTEREISLSSDTIEKLLYDFLSELVFLKDSEAMVFSEFEVKIEKDKNYSLTAKIKGETIAPERHKLGQDVKAITMHMFSVKEVDGGYKARVIVDI